LLRLFWSRPVTPDRSTEGAGRTDSRFTCSVVVVMFGLRSVIAAKAAIGPTTRLKARLATRLVTATKLKNRVDRIGLVCVFVGLVFSHHYSTELPQKQSCLQQRT
jgi:hypothetical protein